MKLITLVILIITGSFSFCSNINDVKPIEEKEGKYFNKTKNSYINLEKIENDTILGHHCFILNEGNRIDCCIDEDFSIKLVHHNGNDYEGILVSCYDDDDEYKVKLHFENEYIVFSFIENNHPFMSKIEKFYK